MLCPNKFPDIDPSTGPRLAVVGEAPGADEMRATDSQGRISPEPFVGASGRFLRAMLASAGGSCNQTFFGNICQHNPPSNDIEKFDWNGHEIQGGLEALKKDLQVFRPNCLLVLGKTAFRALRPDLCYPTKTGYHVPLGDWRGSLHYGHAFGDVKAVATYHPAYILRSYNDKPFFAFDVAKAVEKAERPDYAPILRYPILRPTMGQALDYIQRACEKRIPQTLDLEGYPDNIGITMFSLVPTEDPTKGIVIPFWLNGGHYWTEEEEVILWEVVARLLADANVPKTVHAGFYETFVFAWRHKCIINNIADDTMFAHWELHPDFAKGDREEKQKVSSTQKKRSLGICASIYTDQSFYKDDRVSNDPDVKLNYSFLDSSTTAQVRNVTRKLLEKNGFSLAHYRFNINLIPAYNYIMLRGCKFDVSRAVELSKSVGVEVDDLNLQINHTLEERGAFGQFPCKTEKKRVEEGFNVKSNDHKRWLLYDHLSCKPLKKFETETGKPGVDEDALLHYHQKTSDPLIRLVIRCVRKRTRLSDIGKLLPDTDGRFRTSYDLVGTNTGRLSSRASMSLVLVDGEWVNAGSNIQNVTKELRCCFIPDSQEWDMWQFDLSGADGWTVGAELASIGYPTMLEDYLAGIKPSLVLYHMLQEFSAGRDPAAVNRLPRNEIKQINDRVKSHIKSLEGKLDADGRPLDWLYLCCKRVQHGSNYGMGEERVSELVFGDSDGTIVLSAKDAKFYQYLYQLRYKTDVRNDWIRKTLAQTGSITASCGIKRVFYAIRSRSDIDDEIVRQASSFNPQANTTHITNRMLEAMYYDGRNRTSQGQLFVQPLIQVHDSFAGQNQKRIREWAHERLKEWAVYPMVIAGQKITIPSEGHYGENWRDTKEDI